MWFGFYFGFGFVFDIMKKDLENSKSLDYQEIEMEVEIKMEWNQFSTD